MEQTDWHNLYGGGGNAWMGDLVPEAVSHPAKFPRGVIRRVYAEMHDRGWLPAGAHILDPFGGVAGGALDALLNGHHWHGVELNPAYVSLGQANIALWQRRYGPYFDSFGRAELRQGDSRQLTEYFRTGAFAAVIASPPYAQTRIAGAGDEGATGLRNPDGSYVRGAAGWAARQALGDRYGATAGNLGHLAAEPDSAGPETFWAAAATILAQCYALLAPGGVTAFMTGDYIRDRRRVEFSAQWLAACEGAGFTPLLWARVWKAEDHGSQLDVFGGQTPRGRSRVSFWRREANRRHPESAIENEDIVFVRKS